MDHKLPSPLAIGLQICHGGRRKTQNNHIFSLPVPKWFLFVDLISFCVCIRKLMSTIVH